ncbi:1-aminocyclopropane-1-carboxylate deaminase/D-cysteine desulfhydrase [Shewanella olleyana]|uniref:1-aminocyclopropane-1-carboxylate deaminase/D-cysteine desulfhydrase n=1 Tax=Shewanella olleyana TaxID=135626 RepID=UPI00200E9DF9|nr:1-aminocyclopropane-1-carboxylate deaminase/D-cysteine desulfhydrase [Shewanella olleyana]MCL1067899.1 1-aminocyclopropane-1-carboxylate deaminase/D-cysteine desulfhydrase [Shewanella olleyana]
MFAVTPVESMTFANREIFIKRDDLIHPDFSGNKARKFQYFLGNDFSHITKVIGYGSAQANSLHSLAALAKMRGWQLDYYVDHIASYLKQNPQGNYLAALNNGANIIEMPTDVDKSPQLNSQAESSITECTGSESTNTSTDKPSKDNNADKLSVEEYVTHLSKTALSNELYIPEGGRCEYASEGIEELGQQILDWAIENNYIGLNVFLPSGTGTTALFLQRFFVQKSEMHKDEHCPSVKVLTCSCVGGDDYLKLQFNQLTNKKEYHPHIVSNGKKFHFGKLERQCYQMWQRVCQSGIEFELLYDPVGFIMLEHFLNSSTSLPEVDKSSPVLYVHQGGVLGNPSMLARYQRKFGLEGTD